MKSSVRLPLILLIFLVAFLLSTSSEGAKRKRVVKRAVPATPAPEIVSVNFFTFGDWGVGNENQKAVADQTKKICAKYRCDFGLTLGDNFYYWGISSVNDNRWQTLYRDMYGDLKVPFFAVLGNHDWLGNAQTQIEFSKKDPYWKMPANVYTIVAPESGPPLLEIFVLASDRFNREGEAWLKKSIEVSKAPWKILAFHHPILSNTTAREPDQKKMGPKLKPIVCKKIDLILSGHDHIFSHLRDTTDTCGWDQVIIGTGGADLYGINKDVPENLKVLHTEANFGLGFVQVTEKELSLKFYQADGDESYSYKWKKPEATPGQEAPPKAGEKEKEKLEKQKEKELKELKKL